VFEFQNILIVSPGDMGRPAEDLNIQVHTRIRGYLKEAVDQARRVPDRHVAAGYAHLCSLGSMPGFTPLCHVDCATPLARARAC